jgi:hypothetical protein
MFSEPMAATTELRPAKTDRQPDAQSRPALQADVVDHSSLHMIQE